MRALVAYFSQTGNTKKVGETIYQAIRCEKDIKEFSDITDVNPYDLLFIGFPIQAFNPAEQGKEFMNTYCQHKQVALFITHAAPGNFIDLPIWIDRCKEPLPETNIKGVFNCQGEVSESLLDFALESDDPVLKQFGKFGGTAKGQPDAAQFKRAREFAEDVVAKFSK